MTEEKIYQIIENMSYNCFLQNDFTHFCNQKYTILQSEYINNKTFKSIDI